jgi:hypothetical protein
MPLPDRRPNSVVCACTCKSLVMVVSAQVMGDLRASLKVLGHVQWLSSTVHAALAGSQ